MYSQGILLWFIAMLITHEFNVSNSDSSNTVNESVNLDHGDYIDDGNNNLTARIFGGTSARDGEFPWQIAIYVKDVYLQTYTISCSGSLIASEWVLTAAHCVVGLDSNNMFIQIGKTNLNLMAPNERKIDVSRIIIHSQFNRYNFLNDIALLKLRQPVVFTSDVSLISLPNPASLFENADSIASGWGVTSEENRITRRNMVDPNLQKVNLKVWQDIYCSKNPNFICAGGTIYGGQGVCNRDSGGPLQAMENGRYVLIGIISHGLPCAKPRTPDFFVKTSYYRDWIYNTMAQNAA